VDQNRIRIVLGGMPPLLHDIVIDALAGEAEIEVVRDLGEENGVVPALSGGTVDVVIVGARQPEDSALAARVFRASPHSRVLVIATSGRSAVMHQLAPVTRTLGELSPQGLVEAIRGRG
jgi:DNA-binding transcriptional LysR family regulator